MTEKLKIISRNSRLALWQAEYVRAKIQVFYPHLSIEIIGVTTTGDRILDKSLDKIGGKGLFVKELEQQLLSGEADIAVHSLKDLPVELPVGLTLAAILPRDSVGNTSGLFNPCDAMLSNDYPSISAMPPGSVIGTSSGRRMALLKKYYPHIAVKLLRGNVPTRLAKLDNKEYAAIILAVAGLNRLGLAHRIRQILPAAQFIPAIGQGALAVETCKNRNDLIELLSQINDATTQKVIGAEREMGCFLNASCNVPIGGFGEIIAGKLHLTGFIADVFEGNYLIASASGELNDFLGIGHACAQKLLSLGAQAMISKYSPCI